MRHHPRYSNTRYSNSDTDFIPFVFIILLASAAWEHKAGLLQVEYFAKYFFLILAIIFISLFVVKTKRKVTGKLWLNRASLKDIDQMPGLEFERYLTTVLKRQGYESIRLTEKYDYGVDIIAVKNGVAWGIQAKRYKGLVDADAVRQVVAALPKYRCERSMVITNSHYTEVAKELARWNNCQLIDRDILKLWVV